MLQCHLKLLLGSKLFCEAVDMLQSGIMTLCKTKFSNKLGFIKYLHLKLVMLMVKVNLPRLTLVVKQNKL